MAADPQPMICETTLPFGASWGADDTIIFSRGRRRIVARAGQPVELRRPS